VRLPNVLYVVIGWPPAPAEQTGAGKGSKDKVAAKKAPKPAIAQSQGSAQLVFLLKSAGIDDGGGVSHPGTDDMDVDADISSAVSAAVASAEAGVDPKDLFGDDLVDTLLQVCGCWCAPSVATAHMAIHTEMGAGVPTTQRRCCQRYGFRRRAVRW